MKISDRTELGAIILIILSGIFFIISKEDYPSNKFLFLLIIWVFAAQLYTKAIVEEKEENILSHKTTNTKGK